MANTPHAESLNFEKILQSEKTERALTKISKLHFLIHPGQTTDPNSDEVLQKYFESHNIKYPVTAKHSENFKALSGIYLSQAREIASHPDELMVAFLHKSGKRFRKDYKAKDPEALYAVLIGQLKKILGNRLIVLSNDFDIVRDHNEDLDAMQLARNAFKALVKAAKAKGFEIDQNVDNGAYGEQLLKCVEWGSLNLNIANRLKRTIIRPKLTEKSLEDPELKEAKKRVKRMEREQDPRLRHIGFDFN